MEDSHELSTRIEVSVGIVGFYPKRDLKLDLYRNRASIASEHTPVLAFECRIQRETMLETPTPIGALLRYAYLIRHPVQPDAPDHQTSRAQGPARPQVTVPSARPPL